MRMLRFDFGECTCIMNAQSNIVIISDAMSDQPNTEVSA
ncbi:hypothetical protein FHT91_000380 [Rhizobium sp. BK347]|nr:hypothetical protein [Rhizobium sp. BK252]MBB3400162.1 hypothetical protein [Rhizobium sp. BK289]MBB3412742.1 hypothetical protein [Rhizobium sp. BK284]MBB3480628.1 hypothetical protein [Rhizobium sp. BK347]